MGLNNSHDHRKVFSFDLGNFDWFFYPPYVVTNMRGGTIKMGSDVWLGYGVHLKSASNEKPLTIGDGAIIAADSVVVKDVEPYTIVGGNPAKFIKYRFSEDVIEALMKIKWWNWPADKIYENWPKFQDPKKFAEEFSS